MGEHVTIGEQTSAQPTLRGRLLRLAVGTTVFVIAGYIGRSTILENTGAALVWPAIGVGALWLGNGDRRTWPWDASALALAAVIVNVTTGATLPRAALFAANNLLQIFVFILIIRRWVPDLWAFRGTQALHRLVDLVTITLAGTTAGLAGALFSIPASLAVLGEVQPATLAVVWGRNVVALVVITVIGTVVGPRLVETGSMAGLVRRIATDLRPRSVGRTVEAVLLVGISAVLVVLIFAGSDGEPLAFLLLATSVWAGLRFSPVVVVLLGAAVGGFGIKFTLDGHGPFVAIESLHGRALVSQAFVMMAVLTGLALALSRAERNAAIADVARAERAAADRARLLDAVLSAMTEGVSVVEPGGVVVVRNDAARSLVGIPHDAPQRVLPASAYQLFHTDGQPLLDHEFPGLRALAGEEVEPEDFQVRSPLVPLERVVEISARPLPQEDPDAPPRAMVNIRDVTADRQHTDSLASFAGVVAHDLFNPLSVVNGWAEALEDEFNNGAVPPTVGMPIVARIHDATAHMRLLISDLMSYTVARDQSLRPASVDLTTLLRELRRLYADYPSAPVIAVDDDLVVWGDEALLRQLFDNLFGNAVKYVASGTRPAVAVSGTREGYWLTVQVTDNGIGIPDGQRDEIFDPFHRAHRDTYQGTGLGLAICRRIVDRHGGTIWVEDGPNGLGSAFTLRLPTSPEALVPRSGTGSGEQQAEDDDILGYPFST